MTRDRALASGLIAFVALIIMAAFLFTLMQPAIGDILPMMLSQNPPAEAETAIEQRQTIWGGVLFYVLLLGAIMLIARSVFESRRPL